MKVKLLTGMLIIVLLILFAFIYLFIPSTMKLSVVQTITVPPGALVRCFNNPDKMEAWWPGDKAVNNGALMYKGMSFRFSNFNITEIQKVAIYMNAQDSLVSATGLSTLGKDISLLYWNGVIETGSSPWNRISQYIKGVRIKHAIKTIFTSLSAYTADVKNIYGVSIARGKVPDSVFISEKKLCPVYPVVTDIYSSIHSLSSYLNEQNVKQTGYPICNITPTDSTGFNLIVAIPINKRIAETATKKIKNMLYNGNILVTETIGGENTINAALAALKSYADDYRLTPAVLPYQSLVTDREKVSDTSKWLTKICYPIY